MAAHSFVGKFPSVKAMEQDEAKFARAQRIKFYDLAVSAPDLLKPRMLDLPLRRRVIAAMCKLPEIQDKLWETRATPNDGGWLLHALLNADTHVAGAKQIGMHHQNGPVVMLGCGKAGARIVDFGGQTAPFSLPPSERTIQLTEDEAAPRFDELREALQGHMARIFGLCVSSCCLHLAVH